MDNGCEVLAEPLLYTRRQTSRLLQISLAALDQRHRLRQRPHCLILSGRRLYPRKELEQFIAEQLAQTKRNVEIEVGADL
jgi:hypothetical protein